MNQINRGPWPTLAPLLILLLLLPMLGYQIGLASHAAKTPRGELFAEKSAQPDAAIKRLSQEISFLTANLANSETAVDRLTTKLEQLQIESVETTEELVLFRSLARGKNRQSGLSVQRLLLKEESPSRYRAELMLTQARARDRISGHLRVEVEGAVQDYLAVQTNNNGALDAHLETQLDAQLDAQGETTGKTLSLRELTAPDTDSSGADTLAFDFRYFQAVDTELVLPAEFVPQTIVVSVIPQGKTATAASTLVRRFEWNPISVDQ